MPITDSGVSHWRACVCVCVCVWERDSKQLLRLWEINRSRSECQSRSTRTASRCWFTSGCCCVAAHLCVGACAWWGRVSSLRRSRTCHTDTSSLLETEGREKEGMVKYLNAVPVWVWGELLHLQILLHTDINSPQNWNITCNRQYINTYINIYITFLIELHPVGSSKYRAWTMPRAKQEVRHQLKTKRTTIIY